MAILFGLLDLHVQSYCRVRLVGRTKSGAATPPPFSSCTMLEPWLGGTLTGSYEKIILGQQCHAPQAVGQPDCQTGDVDVL